MKSESTMVIRQDQNTTASGKPKYTQKFCEKWLHIFSPWLSRCEDDPNKPFCRACQCRLDCNRCHLQRHERTSKHARNLEILVNKGEGAARQNLSIRQERSKYYQQRRNVDTPTNTEDDSELELATENDYYIDDNDTNQNQSTKFQYEEIPKETFTVKDTASKEDTEFMDTMKVITGHNKLERELCRQSTFEVQNNATGEKGPVNAESLTLLQQIHKDKNDLMDSFKELVSETLASQTASKERSHVDLFFESVSSSVKALTPKLIAEAKMRVSQLICELELRALTENDTQHQT